MDTMDTDLAGLTHEGIARIRRTKRSVSEADLTNSEHLHRTLEGLKSLRYESYAKKPPWLDEEGNVIWSPFRMRVGAVVFSQLFETIMGLIIVGNIVLIMIEANQDAKCFPNFDPHVHGADVVCPHRSDSIEELNLLNLALLLAYTVECAVRLYVERGPFFCNKWNMIDLVTVLLGWASMLLASVVNLSLLRLSRLIRVLRAIRVFISVPEFYLLVTGLYSSIKAILFGSIMLLFVIIFWAIVSVELLHPTMTRLNWDACPDCKFRFGDVFSAGVTLFQQIVAGDSWGQISLPLIAAEPVISVMLFIIMMTISLGVMNLILAVIVERATEARENDHEQRLKQKQQERAQNMIELAMLCANLDKDQSGTVSLEEMQHGYDNDKDFKKLIDQMDIKRDEMELIFHVLDSDNSGHLSYLEFCKNLGSFFKRDPVIMHSLIRCSVADVKNLIQTEVVSVMRKQHEELLRGQQKLLAAFGLLPGAEPRQIPVPLPKLPDLVMRTREPLKTMEYIDAELEPLLAKIETIASSLDASVEVRAADACGEQARLEPKSVVVQDEALADEDRAQGAERIVLPGPANNVSPEVEVRYAQMCHSFQRRAEEAERLQRRLYNAIQYLSVLRGFDEVDPSHAKYYEV